MGYSKRSKISIWIGSICAVIIFAIMFFSLFLLDNRAIEIKEFNDGWYCTQDDKQIENEDASEISFENIEVGTVVIFKNVIPDDFMTNHTLRFTTFLSTVEIYVDGELIYQYGQNLLERQKMVGNGYHMVELPYQSKGKEIEVRITAQENHAFSYFNGFEYGTSTDIYFSFQRNYLVISMIYIFLTVFGLGILILSVISLFLGYRYARFIPVSTFSFLIGMYGLSSSKYFEMCGISNYANTICEYESLYLAPIPATLLFLSINKRNERLNKLLHFIIYSWVVFDVVLNILHFTNISHFPKLLVFYHYFGFFCIILGIVLVIINLNSGRSVSKLGGIGFCVLCGSSIIDMIRYYLQKSVSIIRYVLPFSIIPIGTLVFILI